jgi:hypothetical protein
MHHRNELSAVWALDVHLLVAGMSTADLNAFAELARARRVAAVARHGLIRAMGTWGRDVPGWLVDSLEGKREEPSAEYLKPGRRWRHELSSSLGHLTMSGRLRLLREIALPQPAYMRALYPTMTRRFGSVGLTLSYAHRLGVGVSRILAGHK